MSGAGEMTRLPTIPAPTEIEWSGIDDERLRGRILAAVDLLTDELDGPGGGWQISELPGGASNLNFKLEVDGRAYALRVSDYDAERIGGTRQDGFEIQSAAAAGGIAPAVRAYCLPEGHCICDFVEGVTLDAAELRRDPGLAAAARLLRKMHDLEPVAASWSAFRDIARYQGIAAAESLELPADLLEPLAEMDRLSELLDSVPGAQGFCHNDLQIPNFIRGEGTLWLVDWEYAGTGNRYFDLGGVVSNAELTEAEIDEMVVAYFGPTAMLEVEKARIELMRLVSATRESIWAVVAEPVLDNDWDYRGWAEGYAAQARATIEGGSYSRLLALAAES